MDPDLFSTHSLLSNKISSRIRFVVFLFFFFSVFLRFFLFLDEIIRDYSQKKKKLAEPKTKKKEKKKKESHDDKEVKPVLLAIHWPMFCISFFLFFFFWDIDTLVRSVTAKDGSSRSFYDFIDFLLVFLILFVFISVIHEKVRRISRAVTRTLHNSLPLYKKPFQDKWRFIAKKKIGGRNPNVNGFSGKW